MATKNAPTQAQQDAANDKATSDPHGKSGLIVKNNVPRLLRITAATEDGETFQMIPGRSYELTNAQAANAHVQRWYGEGYLVDGEDVSNQGETAFTDASKQTDQQPAE